MSWGGSLRQPPSHKSTVAKMKGGEDPVETGRGKEIKMSCWIDNCYTDER